MSRFTYTDNWLSECHERFCTLAWHDWTSIVRSAGFEIDPRSGPWTNEWMVENIFRPAVELTMLSGEVIPSPATHVFIVAIRPLAEV